MIWYVNLQPVHNTYLYNEMPEIKASYKVIFRVSYAYQKCYKI